MIEQKFILWHTKPLIEVFALRFAKGINQAVHSKTLFLKINILTLSHPREKRKKMSIRWQHEKLS